MHITTKLVISEIILMFILQDITLRQGFPLVFDYQIHKVLHIIGGVMFLGNIIITGVWMYFAIRTKDNAIIQFSAKMTNWMDVFFTAPGVILVLLNGFIMAQHWGDTKGFMAWINTPWLLSAVILFMASGVIWVYLIYLQEKFIKVTQDEKDDCFSAIKPYANQWFFWGITATVLPLISIVIMVIKKGLF